MLLQFLPLASFGRAPYSFHEAGIVNCVVKTGCAVGARMQIAEKLRVDLTHIDGCLHACARDRSGIGFIEFDT